MKKDSKLSGVLHVLLHLAQERVPITSQSLARALDTNPVVLRRIMGGLRNQGYVRSDKGHGGGWTLSCDLDRVTLKDVYEALGSPPLFAIGNRSNDTKCLIEKAVNEAMSEALLDAEARLMLRFSEITLSDIGADFFKHMAECGGSVRLDEAHS